MLRTVKAFAIDKSQFIYYSENLLLICNVYMVIVDMIWYVTYVVGEVRSGEEWEIIGFAYLSTSHTMDRLND